MRNMAHSFANEARVDLVEQPLPAGEDDALLGFHWTKVADPAAGLGEVYVVAVSPDGQGRGLGRLLTAVGLQYLAGRGLAEVELYVEGDNTPALATYTRAGFARRDVHVMYSREVHPPMAG